jgi:NDP-sugar pyrophosphorylase family protein
VRAIVVADGEGTCLRPSTLTGPKQMISIMPQAKVECVLGHLAPYGIDEPADCFG